MLVFAKSEAEISMCFKFASEPLDAGAALLPFSLVKTWTLVELSPEDRRMDVAWQAARTIEGLQQLRVSGRYVLAPMTP